eukprot:7560802-Lingulodinium_polyedra.AAC.1
MARAFPPGAQASLLVGSRMAEPWRILVWVLRWTLLEPTRCQGQDSIGVRYLVFSSESRARYLGEASSA